MKGVILAGGTGTRLQPFTLIMNKHLLPVGRFPMIYWPIFSLRDAGITDILIITNEDHLPSFVKVLGDGESLQVHIQYQIQKSEGGGIADALMNAKQFINHERFVAVLGDNIFEDSLLPYVESFKRQEKGARVLLKEVSDASRYGVPQLADDGRRITHIIEKPEQPPSSYSVTGIYMYDQDVFNLIEKVHPSSRNELEITDVNNLYIERSQLEYDVLEGWWVDAGTHDSIFMACQYVNELNRSVK